ncbi:MAG: transcriptional regulator [Thermoplasmata archaeon]|nr:transcriptional regulator [Thermoplasmata archaeon]
MAGQAREDSIDRIQSLLESAGFYVSDAHSLRPSSFDLLARRDSFLLIVKVLKNIDALDPEEAGRLRELAELFPAVPILIGQTSGAMELESGVVYNRYGIPIIVEESLRDYLSKGIPPFLVSSPGGIFARVDGVRLRRLREDRQISLGTLASVAGVSRRTIQLYEDGSGAEVTVIERIERFLGEPVAVPIELFRAPGRPRDSEEDGPGDEEGSAKRTGTDAGSSPDRPARRGRRPASTGDPLRDGVFRQLDGMGWEVVVTVRAPFDAFTRGTPRTEQEILLTSVGSFRNAQHRAEILQQLAKVAEGHALFVVREALSRTSIDGLPIVTMPELKRHRDRDELLDTITEREGS